MVTIQSSKIVSIESCGVVGMGRGLGVGIGRPTGGGEGLSKRSGGIKTGLLYALKFTTLKVELIP